MNNIKASINIPWADAEGSWKGRGLGTEQEAYSKVPLIYRAIRVRVNSLLRVPVYVYPVKGKGKDKAKDSYFFEDSLPLADLLRLSEISLLLKGGNWILKNQNRFNIQKGLQWINPFSMMIEYKNNRIEFHQQLPNGSRNPPDRNWTVEDFIYMRDFNPENDLGPGVSATQVALGDAKILSSVTDFMGNVFTADGLPITMVVMPTGTSPAEVTRVQNSFRDLLNRAKKAAARIIGVTGDTKIEKLTAEMKSMAFTEIDAHAILNIAHAYDIPKTILTSDSANFATASVEDRSFTERTIIPRCNYYESVLNPFLAEFGQRIEFAPEELPEMQEDEEQRAGSLKQLVDAGIPLLAALDILGYDLSDEALALIEKEIQDKEKRAEEFANRIQQPANGEEEQPTNGQTVPPAKADLDKWMRKSLSSFKAGGDAMVDFTTKAIPGKVQEEVIARLLNAGTEIEIRDIFQEVSNGH